jgi:glutamate-1-semialdehyde 2,1-aminomutase
VLHFNGNCTLIIFMFEREVLCIMTATTPTTAQTSPAYSIAHSQAAFTAACQVLPGGVNSPVRAFKGVGKHPIFMQRAEGPLLWDVDGNRYIDMIGSWGPAILGHAHPAVQQALLTALPNGCSFGTPTLAETTMAQQVIAMVPSVEKVRFVNSGTEAAMSGLRLARAVTGKRKVIKFNGCYHGHVDALLVQAGSGVATLGLPDSPGVMGTADTLTAEFNNLESVAAALASAPDDVAGILIEPVAGNMGCVLPQPGFLQGLRTLATQHNALLVFDEVMTGFRLAPGGAQALLGVTPDISLFGKIIGGGLPVGAYGASQAIMAIVAPEGPMYQAGTLSGNPLAMAAGLATLQQLAANPAGYAALDDLTRSLAEGLKAIMQAKGVPVVVNQLGSMLTVFFTQAPAVTNYTSALTSDRSQFASFFWHMAQHGVYLPPSQFESWFLSMAHTADHIQHTLTAAQSWQPGATA